MPPSWHHHHHVPPSSSFPSSSDYHSHWMMKNPNLSHQIIIMTTDDNSTSNGFQTYKMDILSSSPSTSSPSISFPLTKAPSPDIDTKSGEPSSTSCPTISLSPSKEHNSNKGGLTYSSLSKYNKDTSPDIDSYLCLVRMLFISRIYISQLILHKATVHTLRHIVTMNYGD